MPYGGCDGAIEGRADKKTTLSEFRTGLVKVTHGKSHRTRKYLIYVEHHYITMLIYRGTLYGKTKITIIMMKISDVSLDSRVTM